MKKREKKLKIFLKSMADYGIFRQRREFFVSSKCIFTDEEIQIFVENIEPLQSEHIKKYKCVCKNKNMIDVLVAAKYLIQLYYKTEEQFRCTGTKIEKLLSIAAMIEMKHHDLLFADEIVINLCGTGIPVVSEFTWDDIIDGKKNEDGNDILRELINEDAYVPAMFNIDKDMISCNIKRMLEDLFFKFGNFSSKRLGVLLDEFKKEISMVSPVTGKEIIGFAEAYAYFNDLDKLKAHEGNIIVNYIFNYTEDDE